MTRKHYEAMAKAIRNERWAIDARGHDDWDGLALARAEYRAVARLALRLAQVAGADNPRFDLGRFLDACGVAPDEVAEIEAEDRAKREAVLASLREATK